MKIIRTLLPFVFPFLAPTLHAASLVVTNVNDSGAGSLRQALADAAVLAGADVITFAPGLSGQSVALGGVADPWDPWRGATALIISDAGGVTLDATALPGGLTLHDGAGTGYRCFRVAYGSTLALRGLTVSGFSGEDGGAIFNDGTLTLTQCSLSGNSASFGGAIFNCTGTLTLTQCSLSGNSASGEGGAIYNDNGTLTLTQCSLSGNSAGGNGGAIYNYDSSATLTQCTLSGNSARNGGGAIESSWILRLTNCSLSGNSADYGGAISNSRTLTVINTIAAGNTAAYAPDISNGVGTITPGGVNLIGDLAGSSLSAGPNVIVGAPMLAPLANYGGPTQTMALLPGSPARNAAAGLTPAITSDQRGFPIVGTADIGAYESGTVTNFENFIWETLPATATPAQHAAAFDYDGDAASNEHEWLAGTLATDPASVLRLALTRSGNDLLISFPSVSGRTYTLQRSDDLTPGSWTTTGLPAVPGNGSVKQFSVPAGPAARRFFRVQAGP